MIALAIIFSFGYLMLIIWFVSGWIKLKGPIKTDQLPDISFSIIIPARNEAENIIRTIEDIAAQHYPKDLFELIILDDDSDDNTFFIAQNRINDFQKNGLNFKIIKLPNAKHVAGGHKKMAIEFGINIAKNNWIVSTDADCMRGPYWLYSLAKLISAQKPVLVSSPVLFQDEHTFFQKMQSLEFLSLVGMGAASIANGSPNLCNGANLAYKKEAFIQSGGFTDNIKLSSGDDEFLMHKIAKLYPGKVAFLKDKDATVFTRPQKSLSEFIQQRKRWVSKSTKYRKKEISFILLFVYVFHLMILSTGLASVISVLFLKPFIILLVTKIFAELILVLPLCSYFGKLRFIPLYPLAAIFYVVYVVCIGIIGNTGKYVWKGRKVS